MFEQLPSEFRELGAHYRAGNPDGVTQWLALERKNIIDPATQAAARLPLLNKVPLENLGRLRMPALLLTGDADLYTPPSLLHELRQAIPNGRAEVIAGAGHAPHWEQPRVFNALLLEFLGANRRP